MPRKAQSTERREDALSRDRIIEAAIALLDRDGEAGLTFRALAQALATGAGAIYWHIANKSDLLTAACDAIMTRTLSEATQAASTPQARIRAIALALFDAMDQHPWVGSALTQAPGQLPSVRMLEHLGQQVRALGVAAETQWIVTCTLQNYITGVGEQNAVNSQFAQHQGLPREGFLDDMARTWSALDQEEFPFTRSMAPALRAHDDQADFLAGIDLILAGVHRPQR
ncbi:TetR/AcrR family transcriptional regulator [Silvimonas iriomotensis]|uniref:TetR family transcriptional regulator n=1 Tax=Silvimonas iriomotensis TaxID=449662 RepID=A0ABQ2P9Z2_9NEIS|nr:TetR/AcrR family transcriptional regulator [Silvimonas iriomotensis]GGP21551.1 TetR family transcriptional regulator [Silvimonas iriomotensis]